MSNTWLFILSISALFLFGNWIYERVLKRWPCRCGRDLPVLHQPHMRAWWYLLNVAVWGFYAIMQTFFYGDLMSSVWLILDVLFGTWNAYLFYIHEKGRRKKRNLKRFSGYVVITEHGRLAVEGDKP